VGESDVDRAIGDLMTATNPTVALAAHPGQTDVRITAKADTEAEASAMIAPLEAELRRRLGIAIYGVEKETVAGAVGRLLTERGLKLSVIDTLTDGWVVREIVETGFGDLIAADLCPASPVEALQVAGLAENPDVKKADGFTQAAALAKVVAPDGGVGLALLGPLDDGVNDNMTFIAVSGDTVEQEVRQRGRTRRFQKHEESYIRRWLVIQGLDWVRRALLGQLTSPVDWK
jgi:hypothetical protein